jgi:NADH:ubiquinone oxidoreductase subunit C
VSKKANKVIKNNVVNDSFCKLEVLALNVCGLVSKLRNPDFREFISLYGIICLTETKLDNYDEVELDGYPSIVPLQLGQTQLLIIYILKSYFE